MENEAKCLIGVKNMQEIDFLKREVQNIKNDIKDLKNDLVKRPSWAVTVVITLLSSATFASLTFAFTVAKLAFLHNGG